MYTKGPRVWGLLPPPRTPELTSHPRPSSQPPSGPPPAPLGRPGWLVEGDKLHPITDLNLQ